MDTTKKDIIEIINKHANKTTVSDTQSDERILSPIYQRNNRSDWQDIKQTQYPTTIFKLPIFKLPKKIGHG